MRRPLLFAVGLVCLSALLQPPTQADAARQAIQAGYQKASAAMSGGNASAFLAVLTPDFQAIDNRGQVLTRAKIAHLLASRPADPKVKLRVVIRQFSRQWNKATVSEVQQMVSGGGGSSRTIGTYQDLWIKSGSRWLWKQSRTRG